MHQDTAATLAVPTAIGAPFEGGFYAGTLLVNGQLHALIVAPRPDGETKGPWLKTRKDVPGAGSFFDGLANTRAMAEAGSPLAQWALGLQINGCSDWYLPSRDELELLYRHLKPTAEENVTWRGDNPSSVPVGYPYSPTAPGQTAAAAFQEDGDQALTDSWYWSSTQRSAVGAWLQLFDDGSQGSIDKGFEGRARAVRRLVIE